MHPVLSANPSFVTSYHGIQRVQEFVSDMQLAIRSMFDVAII